MKWDHANLNVFLDISTYCNAGCPQCHRTNPDGLDKVDWLPLVQWSVDQFKKAFPPKELKNIRKFKFCGTWGDPIMNKDILKIFEYIHDVTPSIIISIDTNGSLRDENFWWKIGVLLGKKLEVIFAVDGIDQKMHEIYRRFTNLDKVLAHMNILSQTNAIVKSQTILFKHNKDYKEEIINLVKLNGSQKHSFVISDRFENKNKVKKYIDNNGKDFKLEKASQEVLPDGIVAGTKKHILDKQITCRWAEPRNEIVVNPDGQILPCCYHANSHYSKRKFTFHKIYGLNTHTIYADIYNQNLEKYNIFHTPLSEILTSEWYTKILPQSIEGNNPIWQCEKQCSNRVKPTHQIRVEYETT